VAASMRRYAVAWENSFRADVLADLIAALEQLVVGDNNEVSYKLRMRVAYFLFKSKVQRHEAISNLNKAYSYRSRVFHGEYVFDNPHEIEVAKHLTKKIKANAFQDVKEINRLIPEVSKYYRKILEFMIDHGQMKINWTDLEL